MHVLRNNEARSRNHCSHGKAKVLHILTVSLALVIQHTKGMHSIISSTVARMTTTFCQPTSLYHNFRHYLRNGTILGNNLLNMKCVSIFCTTFVWNISHFTKNSARYHKFTQIFMWSTPWARQILIKLELCWQIFEKHSNIKFRDNPSSGSSVVPCGQTDGRTEWQR
jgi:hypothetical protein